MHSTHQRQLFSFRKPGLLWLATLVISHAIAASEVDNELQAAQLFESTLLSRINPGAPSESERADLDKIDSIYLQIINKNPGNVDARNVYAEYLWRIKRPAEAMAQWEAAQKVDPKNALVAYHLGGCHLALGDAKTAANYFSQAAMLEPRNAFYHFTKGNTFFLFRDEAGDSRESAITTAFAELKQATELEPFNIEYAKAYAETFYGVPSPDWNEALKAWGRFLEISGDTDLANSHLARVNLNLGRKKEARACLEAVKDPKFDHLKRRLSERIDKE